MAGPWAISEPERDVTHVEDSEGHVWARTDNPMPWVTFYNGTKVSRTWIPLLIHNGPLTDATERMREG